MIDAAASPVSWGVDFADAETNPPWQLVLDEIARSGCGALELGPLGYLPRSAELAAELERRGGLRVVGSYLFQPLHEPSLREQVLTQARLTSAWVAAAGGGTLVVIDAVSAERGRTAGRPQAARQLSEEGWRQMVATISEVCEIAAEHRLRPVLHPHAGSFIELEQEIDRVLTDVGDGLAGLCLDTGHCAYLGIDPVSLIERHGGRLEHLHLKDVDPAALRRAIDAGLDFWAASDAGVFCRLGEGTVDFAAVGAALGAVGYEGFATIEQDRHPDRTSSSPLPDLIASVEHLREAGVLPQAK